METDGEGVNSLYGHVMWDEMTVFGTVTSCSTKTNQNQTATILLLKNAYLYEDESNPVTHSGQQIQCYLNPSWSVG